MAFSKALVQYIAESDDIAVQDNHWRSNSANGQQNPRPYINAVQVDSRKQ